MVDAALEWRRLMRALAAKCIEAGLTQRDIAERMGTSQPTVARLECGESDPRLSPLERFAVAIGQRIAWRIGARHRHSQ